MKNEEIPKTYDQKTEADIYRLWELSGYFNPDNLKGEPYCIIMPPPNANGSLHLGHALYCIEDVMIRYNRMCGKKTLWLPGADHAGFETQVVYEKVLEKQGTSRFKMKREDFYRDVYEFTQKNKSLMYEQIKRLGMSCDWSRETFTLDPRVIKIVYSTFEKLYDDGLVYRANRVVNWCTKHQTTLSDLEVAYEERTDPLYYMKYGPLTLATVRPETKFGDTAVAVNPSDLRYKDYVGKEIEVEGLLGKFKMTVIADELVDKDFGTGVVKVTPAHDAVDFEIWQKHKNEIPGPLSIIDQFGRIDLSEFGDNEKAKKYHGLKVAEARKLVAEDLQAMGLIEKIEPEYKHNVAVCYKCKNIIEPRVMLQWFVKIKPLAKKAVEAVENKEIEIIPERLSKVYMHWMENIRDWNISRQIWWGIPIPAYFCDDCGEIMVDVNGQPPQCKKCQSTKIRKETDTFDTWFSSGQWPFAALKTHSEKDFETFYPTAVMETGWDILFFWVARMVMLGIYVTGKVPFKTVYLHGLVRDKDRKKMSKSKGNVIDPLGVIDQYGADALRMGLIVGNLPGNDIAISEERIRGYRNFSNKLWNIARFVIQNKFDFDPFHAELSMEDELILRGLDKVVEETTELMDKYDFAHAAENLYHYAWHEFADKIIEESKAKLASPETRGSAQAMLIVMLKTLLKLLHPFMPFVTESIWQLTDNNMLMVSEWPKTKKMFEKEKRKAASA